MCAVSLEAIAEARRKGGIVRAASLSPEERATIARQGGIARQEQIRLAPPTVTPKQAKLLRFINEYQQLHSSTPSMKEMCAAMGVTSAGSMSHMVNHLATNGFIQRNKGQHRSIQILIPMPSSGVRAVCEAIIERETTVARTKQDAGKAGYYFAAGQIAAAEEILKRIG